MFKGIDPLCGVRYGFVHFSDEVRSDADGLDLCAVVIENSMYEKNPMRKVLRVEIVCNACNSHLGHVRFRNEGFKTRFRADEYGTRIVAQVYSAWYIRGLRRSECTIDLLSRESERPRILVINRRLSL